MSKLHTIPAGTRVLVRSEKTGTYREHVTQHVTLCTAPSKTFTTVNQGLCGIFAKAGWLIIVPMSDVVISEWSPV